MKGVGVDLLRVERIAEVLERRGEAFELRILGRRLSEKESAQAATVVAKHFAAKEAVLKALGTGLRNGIRWTDVELGRDDLGKPQVTLHGEAAARLSAMGATDVQVSLSDESGHVIAFAVVD